jgi:hypothetical protein
MFMGKSLFFKKIKCQCGSNFKHKKYRSRSCYICTSADKKQCDYRVPIEESFIKDLCYRRLGQVSDEEIVKVLDRVLVRDRWDIDVYFVGDSKPMIIRGQFNQY